MPRLHPAQVELRKFASTARANISRTFFKTGPGEYGAGDVFIGCSVPDTRLVAKKFRGIGMAEVSEILCSTVHEDRLLALLMMVDCFQRAQTDAMRKSIAAQFIKMRSHINNWDLVDTSAYKIIGQHCLDMNDLGPILRLAKARRHWDRRIAMVASFAFIRAGELDLTYQLAAQFFADPEDLMHKATGWMLREAGKKDAVRLIRFIDRYGADMPRTMLRYAIERFPAPERQRILAKTRAKLLK